MSIFRRKAKAAAPSADLVAARYATSAFWGHSNGSDEALAAAESKLRSLGLSATDLHALRGALPIECGGTTGQRVARIDRVLKRLENEAG